MGFDTVRAARKWSGGGRHIYSVWRCGAWLRSRRHRPDRGRM